MSSKPMMSGNRNVQQQIQRDAWMAQMSADCRDAAERHQPGEDQLDWEKELDDAGPLAPLHELRELRRRAPDPEALRTIELDAWIARRVADGEED